MTWTRPIGAYYPQAAAGTLPPITFVDPPFRDGGGGDGLSADEHPHGDIRLGQAFMADVVNAFVESPQFRARRAVHRLRRVGRVLRPRAARASCPTTAPTAATCRRTGACPASASPRSPSRPTSRRGAVSHNTCTFESILKLISYRYGLGYLNKRHRYAFNIGRTFNWSRPNFSNPGLPDPARSRRRPAPRSRAQIPGPRPRPKEHDLDGPRDERLPRRARLRGAAADVQRVFSASPTQCVRRSRTRRSSGREPLHPDP